MNIFTFFLSLTFLTLVLADEPVTEQAFQIPMWAIIVVAVIIAVLLLVLGYFIIRRYSAKKQTVDTFNELEKHPSTKSDTTTAETIGSFNKTTHSVYKPAMIDQEKLSLPLPPPSTSLFSDKMELNSDDAMKLFEQYTQTDRTKGNGLQQKMGTIRSTLKQSLRRTKSKSRKPDVNHMFDTTATATPKRTSTDLPRTSLSTMSQHTSTTLQASLPGLPLLQDPNSTKTFKSTSIAHHDQDITTTNDNDSQPNFSTDSLPISVSSPLTPSPSPPIPSTPSPALPSYINNNISNNSSSPSPSPPPPPSEKEITDSDPDPIHAARRAIRSASRKSKTRSTLLNEDDVLNLFKQEEEWAAKFGKPNKDNEDDSEDGDTTRFKNKDRQRASISYGYTTISGKSANHTRYITDEMLEKRANTIGRSYQVSSPSQQQQQKSSNLETLFTSPLPKKNQPLSPGNEKLEMAHPFDTLPVPTTKNTNGIDSDKVGSSKYAIPDELLYQQNNDSSSSSSITHGYLQKRPSLATEITSTSNNINNNNNGFLDSPYISSSPSSTINNNNRHRNSIVSNGRKTIQDRMDNFEGRSDQTGSTGHSRKSSGSAATMIRISQQHSQTWSGRSPYMRGAIPQHQRNPNTTSSSPYDEDDENDGFRERTTPIPTPTLTRNHKQQQQQNGDDEDDESLHTKQPMFYTMRSTKPKQRNGLPSWYSPPDDDIPTPSTRHKTPAERERDEYLNTLYGNPRQ
ncbi:hypothetical protein BJ944DRAFT_232658 [Cunninghamella echinulata]|nr:hypothetical protein BJ944DRAFT_232658 [Cunninghamella echinulata]